MTHPVRNSGPKAGWELPPAGIEHLSPILPVAYERFLDCVHCGLCLEACPTYSELGTEADSPRGRIHLMRSLADRRLRVDETVVRHLDLCLGCRACETACPSGVRYGSLIEAARSTVETVHRRSPAQVLLRRILIGSILPFPRRLTLALAPVRLADRLGLRSLILKLIPGSLRRYAELIPRKRRTPPEVLLPPLAGPAHGTVGLLAGCAMPVLYPDVTAATARVLAAAGYRVQLKADGCCGALALHAGDRRGALVAARRTIDSFFTRGTAPLDFLVTNAAGCGAMMRDYGELLRDDPAYAARAAAVASRVRDVSELLDEAADRLSFSAVPLAATYHDACHLAHAQGVREAPRRILARIPELELVPLADADVCCGSAGTYNLTEPEMAGRLRDRKIDCILATGAAAVVTGNPGCMLQIAAGLESRNAAVEVLHTVELIDRALNGGSGGSRAGALR